MSEGKFTSGPFRAFESAASRGVYGVESEDPQAIRDGTETLIPPRLSREDAGLIADLCTALAAIEAEGHAANEHGDVLILSHVWELARAALSKARDLPPSPIQGGG